MWSRKPLLLGSMLLSLVSSRAFAEAGLNELASRGSIEERLARLEAAQSPLSAGDNAWVLVSAALVLMMTAPGLALFYGGMVRRKNVLSTMMHSMFLMGLISILWVLYGYSLTFSEGGSFNGIIGGLSKATHHQRIAESIKINSPSAVLTYTTNRECVMKPERTKLC